MNITNLTLIETLSALKEKKFSEQELNQAYKQRIDQLNPDLNAFLKVEDGSSGIPAGVKDVIVTKGIKTTASSKILENFIPPYDATVVRKLLERGVRVIGKTNCDEFAMGSSGENSAYGPTKNPWDLSKVPGGTSSGSAAAVAADLCVFSLGTDTGGSIRQPASLCGVVGLKPSYGRVSRYGAIAMASSLDQIGPITKSVADARMVLEWIEGEDGFDSNCVKIASPLRGLAMTSLRGASATRQSLKGVRVGVPREYFGKGLDQEVERVIKEAIKKLEELGAETVEVSLPHTEDALAAYYIIVFSEVSSNMAKFDGVRFGSPRFAPASTRVAGEAGGREKFGNEVKRRIMLGTFALSSGYYEDYFAKAAKARTLVRKDFTEAFKKCDVIVGPVSPTTAWNLGEKVSDPLSMYLSDAYTIPASLAGICGLSVPCEFAHGLPVGLQILGKAMDEETVLSVGEVYEQNTEWHKERPKI